MDLERYKPENKDKQHGIDATLTATEFAFDVNVPKEKFEIPAGITISEEDGSMDGQDEEEVPRKQKIS